VMMRTPDITQEQMLVAAKVGLLGKQHVLLHLCPRPCHPQSSASPVHMPPLLPVDLSTLSCVFCVALLLCAGPAAPPRASICWHSLWASQLPPHMCHPPQQLNTCPHAATATRACGVYSPTLPVFLPVVNGRTGALQGRPHSIRLCNTVSCCSAAVRRTRCTPLAHSAPCLPPPPPESSAANARMPPLLPLHALSINTC
jgi:hypothetical protein